jgi:hypothetical protein
MGGVTQVPATTGASRGGGAPVLRFADTARRLGAAARAANLAVPAFRCPPRVPGASRTLRRYTGGAVVSVILSGREFSDVRADMVEGVLAANRLEGEAATRVREALLDALDDRPVLTSEKARVAERQTRAA